MRRKATRFISVRPGLELLENRLAPALFTVNTLIDDNDGLGDGQVSLREAIQAANLAPGADTIDFAVAGTITLTDNLPALSTTGILALDGPGSDLLTVQYLNQATARRLLEILPGSDVSIDGLTFRNGNASTGGAVSSQDSKLLLTDCVFDNNRGSSDGGALFFTGKSTNGHTLTAIDCVFSSNSSLDGGAVFAQPNPYSDTAGTTQFAFTDCLFTSNHGVGSGGALHATGGENSSLSLTDCTFTDNTCSNHGGAINLGYAQNSVVTVSNCDFTGNSAGYSAAIGAVMWTGGQFSITDSNCSDNHASVNGGALFLTVAGPVTITRTVFSGNEAPNAVGGVGIGGALISQGVGGATTITDCYFVENVAQKGGAVYVTTLNTLIERTTFQDNHAVVMGGAVNAVNGGTIQNSTFSENSSDGAGGALIGSSLNIRHSTFTRNRADANGDGNGYGGGIVPGASSVLHNTIVAQNYRGSGSTLEDIFGGFLAGSSNNLVSVNTGISSGTYSLPNGVNGNLVGTAASPLDPLLGPLANNGGLTPTHALLDGSPAIDHGNNAQVTVATDQRGYARIADGPDADGVGVVDIGAYETSLSSSPLPNQETLEDTPLVLSLSVSDTAFGEPAFTLTSDQPQLIPNDGSHLSVTGSAGTYVLTITPAADQSGSAHITVEITLNGQTIAPTFLLTVLPVNDAPTADAGSDQTVDVGATVTLAGTFTDVDLGDTHTFLWQVTASNGQVVASSDASTFNFTPADAATYTATFTVTDGAGAAASDSALVTVNEVAPPPSASFYFFYDHWDTQENWGTKPIYVVRQGGTQAVMTVDITSVAGTALAGSDYQPLQQTLTFGVGETLKQVDLHLLDDLIYEGLETLDVVLSNPTGGGVLGAPSSAVVNITDDDTTFSFLYNHWDTQENWGLKPIVVLRQGDLSQVMTVDVATIAGTAQAGLDYHSVQQTLIFGAGESSRTFDLHLIDDGTHEEPETLQVVLSNPTGPSKLGSPSQAVVNIADDDVLAPGVLQFFYGSGNTNEGWGYQGVEVQRFAGSTGTVSVDYTVVAGSAQNGVDYQVQNGTLTFGDGEKSKIIQINLIDDNLVEGPETLSIILSNPTGGAVLGNPSVMNLTLADNDFALPGTLQFSYANFTTNEGWGYAILCVVRSGGSTGEVSVDYTFTNDSAQNGNDVNVLNGTLTFADGETSKTILVPLVDDSLVEGTEQLFVQLSNPLGGATLGALATAKLTILDND